MNIGLTVLSVALGICLLIELPVAFSTGISCMALLTVNSYPSLDIVIQRMASGAKSFDTMAMPMSIFTDSLMVYGSTPRLMKLVNMMLRRIPGGLGVTALATHRFSDAVPGPGVASAVATGRIIGPEILKQKYSRGLTMGLAAAGGTMACIIPPSIAMMVCASPSGASVGDMSLAGSMPGFACIIILIGPSTSFAVKRGNKEGAEKTDHTAKEKPKATGDALLPPLMPIFVLGGVFLGIYAATETSVMAVIYPFTLAVFVHRELTLWEFYKVAAESVVIADVIMLTISVTMPFGWIMSIQSVPTLFANWPLSITSSKFSIMAFIFLLLLLLGTFMGTMCITILVTPILLPIVQILGMGVVHHGILILMALMVGSLTPPFSVNLLMVYRVPNVKYDEAFLGALRVTLTVTTCALPTFAVPETTELPLAVLKQGEPYGHR